MKTKNFKRVLALLLAMIMILSMTACGGKGGDSNKTGSNVSAEIPEYMNMESAVPIVKEGTDITLKSSM